MRWADLDSLNHVNNVVYVDYAAESRAILIEDGIVGADERVQRMSVDFLRPLLLSSQSVRVTSTRDGDELVQEITNGVADTVYARVTTAFELRSMSSEVERRSTHTRCGCATAT